MSLSKIAILSVVLIALVMLRYPTQRRAVITALVATPLLLCAHRLLFPGLFQIFFNLELFFGTAIVRMADIANDFFGIPRRRFLDALLQLGVDFHIRSLTRAASDLTAAQNPNHIDIIPQGGRRSGFATILNEGRIIGGIVGAVFLVLATHLPTRRAMLAWLDEGVDRHLVAMVTAMILFTLAADIISSQFFWALTGLTLWRYIAWSENWPPQFGDSPRSRDQNSAPIPSSCIA